MKQVMQSMADGRPIVVYDDVGHTGGVLAVDATACDTSVTSLLVKVSSGLLYVALDEARADTLRLPAQPGAPASGPAAAVTVDARSGIGTGISARDRSATVRTLAGTATTADDLTRPGHVMPVRMPRTSVGTRPSAGAAAYELRQLTGRTAATAYASIVDGSGDLADGRTSSALAHSLGVTLTMVSGVVAWRQRADRARRHGPAFSIPTAYGVFRGQGFGPCGEYLAVTCGEVTGRSAPVWLHDECLPGNVLGVGTCRCGPRLVEVLRSMARVGRGVLVYRRAGAAAREELTPELVRDILAELGVACGYYVNADACACTDLSDIAAGRRAVSEVGNEL